MYKLLIFSISVLFFWTSAARGQAYSGPKCLGLVCIDQASSAQIAAKIMRRNPHPGYGCCAYAMQQGGAFLRFYLSDAYPGYGQIALSFFPKPSEEYDQTEQRIVVWRTPQGIGLGSTNDEITRAYGKPTGEETLVSARRGHRILEKELIYRGWFQSGKAEASFDVRNGRTISIEIRKTPYAGPDCLGIFCMDMVSETWTQSLFRESGLPTKQPPQYPYCYQSKDAKMFSSMYKDDAGEPIGVQVSDFPACPEVPMKLRKTTAVNLLAWRTPEGIGLGSPVADVLRVYGQPSMEGTHESGTCSIPKGAVDSVLSYDDGVTSVHILVDTESADFGIRHGTVSAICLYDGE